MLARHAAQRRPISVRQLLLPMLILVLLLPAAEAEARTKTQTIAATVVFANGQRPGDPGNCSAVVFVQWPDVKGATGWKVFYTWKGKELSAVVSPPFSDTYKLVTTYTVPPGQHWWNVSRGWSDGPKPNTCQGTTDKQRTLVGPTARVEITTEVDAAACKAARSSANAKRRIVNRLQAQVKRATGKEKQRLRRALASAKASHAKAVKRVTETC